MTHDRKRNGFRTRLAAAAAAFAVMLVAAPPAAAQTDAMAELDGIRQAAVSAYNARSWDAAASAADRYRDVMEGADLPLAGADYALVAFIGGHARFELWKQAPDAFRYDYDADVLGAMHESLAILQDDPFFKHNVLGTAYYEKLAKDGFRDLDAENAANWHMYKALLARSEELAEAPRDGEEFTAFAKYVLLYISRGFEMARHSEVPEVYLVRLREACRLGLESTYAERFVQLYDVLGWDDGNVRAGVLWQTGLDMMNGAEAAPDEVLATFREAAEQTKERKNRAEILRQMADFASRQDEHRYKLEAVEYGRMAFRLDPMNPEIQQQFGTSLHVVSYAHFNQGRYIEALKTAREAISFEWEGDEVAYFDLSRAQANFGEKIDALVNAEKAYDKARRKYTDDELQPFRQNYVNILRQFGLSAKAMQVEATGQGS